MPMARMAAAAGLSLLLATTSALAGDGGMQRYAQSGPADADAETQADPEMLAGEDIVTVVERSGSFETLLQAAQASGLVETLKGEGPYTIFAPTDEAFDALPEGTVQQLLDPANKAQLAEMMRYHVVEGELAAADLAGEASRESLQGGALRFAADGGAVTVNEAKVAQSDIRASNGIVHAIDAVLMPEGLATGSTGDASGGVNDTAPPTGTLQMSPGGTGTMPDTGGSELRGSTAR